MTNNIQKKKKRSEQIAIEIEQSIETYETLVEEGKKIIELKEREYENKVGHLTADIDKTKKQIIVEAGEYLQKHNLVKSLDKICAKLKRDFKGVIKSPTYIQNCCPKEWRQTNYNTAWAKNKTKRNSTVALEAKQTPLTEYEKQYVEVHDQKVYHNEHIEALIDYYLGMTQQEKTNIIANTPKEKDYQNVLIEKAHDNILKIVKRLNDVDIAPFLADIRFLGKIHRVVSDVAYEEQQLRKKKQGMMGK